MSPAIHTFRVLFLLLTAANASPAQALSIDGGPSSESLGLLSVPDADESGQGSASSNKGAGEGYDFYHISLLPLAAVTAILAWRTRPRLDGENLPEGFHAHQWRYLAVWAPAIAADWLQGPYVYALYASYGYSSDMIARLFVAGFGSSMIFGTLAGSIADTVGRKRCGVLYCAVYAFSCVTKHSNEYGILMLGRIAGGIATSLLFSTFECWMVAEHCQRRGFSQGLLRYMFGLMFFVQYLAAIICGVVAQSAANALPLTKVPGFESLHYGGNTAPFDLSLLLLVGTAPLICFLWDENHGEEQPQGEWRLTGSLSSAIAIVRSDWRVASICFMVASFEGSMFAFVFNWTPALESTEVPPPYGLIFSAFMMACMCGSSVFSLLPETLPPASVLLPLFGLAAMALGVVAHFAGGQLGLVFAAFLAFEFCVGLYFPAVSSLKSEVVPEAARAGVYNLFRVPLNAVVVGLLLTNLSLTTVFQMCSLLIMLAAAVTVPMLRRRAGKDSAKEEDCPSEVQRNSAP